MRVSVGSIPVGLESTRADFVQSVYGRLLGYDVRIKPGG